MGSSRFCVSLRQVRLFRTARWGACVVGLLAAASLAAAQQRFDAWTTENGLPQNSVNAILQTRDGYLWLATHGGLVRFDGLRFVVFDRSIPGIDSQRVRALHEDRQGTLWAATEDGMLIRYRDGRFSTYTNRHGLPEDIAVRIEEGADGALWITWYGHRLSRVQDGEIVTGSAARFGFGHGVTAPPDNRYLDAWWNRDSNGVQVLLDGHVQAFALGDDLRDAVVTGVNVDSRGTVWIRTNGDGVIKAAEGRTQRYTTRDGLPTNHPDGQFYQGSEDEIWFHDLTTYDVYRIHRGRHELMDVPGVRAFYVDREGSTWLGSTTSGVRRFRQAAIRMITERDGLAESNTTHILQDRNGVVWVGTRDRGGLHRYVDGTVAPYRPAGLPSSDLTCLYEDHAGRLWVGSTAGLGYIENGRYRQYRDPSGFLHQPVRAMLDDGAGTFWFATDAGLVRSAGGRFVRYTEADGLADDRTTALFVDRSGDLWIGAQQGLTLLAHGTFAAYTARSGFIGNQVRAFHQDEDGVVWVGTYDGGLYRIAEGRLTRYTRAEGLHDNGVFHILPDAAGYLWMTSNRGLQRVSRRELNDLAAGRRRSVTSVVFDAKDGLVTAETNGGLALRHSNGTLWFPTLGGVAVVDPSAVATGDRQLPAIIESVTVAGAPVNVANTLQVPWNERALEIRYTAPSFTKPEQLRFRYRLIGLDDQWVEAGDRRVVNIDRLPPGHYTFALSAANQVGVWATEGPHFDLEVLPPFWRTWWFMAASVLALATAAIAGHERRLRRLRQEHARQLTFSQELIAAQERERLRISNEMHDSLGQHVTIIGKRVQAARAGAADRRQLDAELDEIGALAEQMRFEMKAIAYDLRPYHLDKVGMSKTIEGLARRVADGCGLHITTAIAPVDHLISEHVQIHLYRIVQEALSNIVRHAEATRAAVRVVRHASSIQVTIEDDGHGFDADATARTVTGRLSFGLLVIRERARILGGTVDIRSAPTGTSIVVTCPVENREGRTHHSRRDR